MDELVQYYVEKLTEAEAEDAWHSLRELGPAALPSLIRSFTAATDLITQVALVEVIGECRFQEGVPFLFRRLEDDRPEVWRAALDGLVKVGGGAVLSLLGVAQARADPERAAWVAEAREQIAAVEHERLRYPGAAFSQLDWQRIDVQGIVNWGGLAMIEEARHAACRDWLLCRGYTIDTIDCRRGLGHAIPALGRLFRWEERFGYSLEIGVPSFASLRDGFEFEIPAGGGHVLELIRPERIWTDDRGWSAGLLWIAQEHTREQLALGRRFFVLLVVGDERSPLVGQVVEEVKIPAPFWGSHPNLHQFLT